MASQAHSLGDLRWFEGLVAKALRPIVPWRHTAVGL